MTHEERILFSEASTAGWHGAKARDAMLDAVQSLDSEDWAVYHARLAARAALRVMSAVEEDGLVWEVCDV